MSFRKRTTEDKTMTTRIKTLIHKSNRSILRLAVPGILTAAVPLFATGDTATNESGHAHGCRAAAAPAKLVEIVRNAPRQFIDVNAATNANGALAGDGV